MSETVSKICLVCQPYHRGGVTRWMVDMAVEYANRGTEVFFVTVQPQKKFISAGNSETIIELLKTSKYQGKIVSQNVGHVFELSNFEYKAQIYSQLLNEYVPKGTPIILSDDYAVWLGSCALANQYQIIAVIHCSISEFYYDQTRKFNQQIAGIVTVSNRCTQKLGNESLPILTQPCGVNISKPSLSIAIKPNVITKVGTLNITWAGRIENRQKRVEDLIKIANLLENNNVNFVLNIIGDGAYLQHLKGLADDAEIQHRIIFHGWQNQKYISETLKSSQIFLLTSNYEGYPVAVMEALAAGCVIVSTRVSGIEDLEKEPDTESILKVFDIGDVSEACHLIQNLSNEDFVILKQKAERIAYKYFSIKTCVDEYNRFIESLPQKTGTKNAIYKVNKLKEICIANSRLLKYHFFNRQKK